MFAARAPVLPRDAIEFVCGWTPAHDEALETIEEIFRQGYKLGLSGEPPTENRSGILVVGGHAHMELRGTDIDRSVKRRHREIREILEATSCAVMFHLVETSLE